MQRTRHVTTSGFTLLEFVISAFVALLALVAILGGYIGNVRLTDMATNRVNFQIETNRFIEDLRRSALTGFDAILAKADANTTECPLSTAGVSELVVTYGRPQPVNPALDLVEVTLKPMWQEGGNRVVGEDTNLNGVLDAGEDQDGIPGLNSPVEFTIRIARQTGS